MCSPAIALVAVTVASTAASMYSQNQQAKYTSAVAEQNADVAEAQAQDSINRGNAEAEQRRREMRQRQGTQTANMAATGAELGSGSSLDIFGDTAQFGTLDALTTVNNAQREAYGLQVQAGNYQSQANAANSAGKSGMSQTLLTAPLQAYGAYQMGGGTWSPFSQKAAPISAAVGTPTGR
ncbi:virion core protein, T7 gp14 family [Citrobacter braakii]